MTKPLESLSFQTLFDVAADAMLLADNLGRVIQANHAALQLLGYTEATLCGQQVEALMPARFRERHHHYRDNFTKNPEKRAMGNGSNLLILTQNGKEIAVDISLSPIQSKGNQYILITFYNAKDIADQKNLEKIIQTQRTETESIFKQQVAARTASAIAHELNQPLAAISAYSEVALHALRNANADPEKLKRALEGCVTQAQRAGTSLHELLAFLQQGELITAPFNLNEIVNVALNIAKGDGYKEFQPILQLEQNMPEVLGNRIQVQKVLVNLLRNAVEAMRGAGVPASAITITVRTNADIGMAHVTVQDNGPGISQDMVKRIFEPFFTTKPTGIGMGLAISRALIEANSGQLWLDASRETGATFHFTLPFAP
ncbi:MAG: ATP-binding protein [Methylotenera sp.]|nr:PAS domain S-box protein [Methylotenera sp.]NOT65025.1 PAS domain S-box protein [Methylotenera sp.]